MPIPPGQLENAIALHRAGRLTDAEAIYRQILAVEPDNANALQLLGALAHQLERHGAAIELIERSLSINPTGKQALNNLGEALRATGQIERSIAAFRRALELYPDYVKAHSNLLLTLHSQANLDPLALRKEHEAWAAQHASGIVQMTHPTERDPDRPLKIGYLSPDFRRHSVAYFIEPAIEHHDRKQFPVYCYSNATRRDEVTDRLEQSASAWRDVAQLNDDGLADLIREDGIDILVDLCGHMARNRLLVLGRKPAPVQATYLGYPNGTGIAQVDFRISDTLADPAGMTDEHYVERIVRLPGCAWCYRPPEMSPAIEAADPARPLTFASFNKFPKITPTTAKLWARILERIPSARLLIKAKSLSDPQTCETAKRLLKTAGMPMDRVTLAGWRRGVDEHLAIYNQVDVALDPFPYHGTTTTCEALWMGVPVVTLAGNAHVSRVGASLLSAVGLDDLVTTTPDAYVDTAVLLANNVARRVELRSTLRDRLSRSPLMDAAGFTRNLEAAYRQMWRR